MGAIRKMRISDMAFGIQLKSISWRTSGVVIELENLLEIVAIKRDCKSAGVEKIDAGPKGAVVSFRDNTFANPAGLVEFISDDVGRTKLRPDHKLVFRRNWEGPGHRLQGARMLIKKLAEIAA